MDITSLAKPSVLTQPVYEPGKPIEDVARELGLDPATIIKLASNENPFGASPKSLDAIRVALRETHRYPDGGCYRLREKLAAIRGVAGSQLVIGNGSNEILELLGHVFLREGDEAVMGNPAFIVYKLVTLLFGATPVEVPLRDYRHDLPAMMRAVSEKTRIVFLPSPNNPTGTANSEEDIFAFARDLPQHVVLAFDEAYAEYLDSAPDLRPLIDEGRHLICLRTFSKIHGLAALRLGYGYTTEAFAQLLNRVRQPFNVNSLAQAAGTAALDDDAFMESCRQKNAAGLRQLEAGLDSLGVSYVPSVANFILVETGQGNEVFAALQKEGVIVRPMSPYGMPNHIRATVGTEEENTRFLRALAGLAVRN